jgi:hypothetical protein
MHPAPRAWIFQATAPLCGLRQPWSKFWRSSTSLLQVQARYPVTGLTLIPGIVFIGPTQVLALSSGQALVRLRQAALSEALLAIWNPASNSFTDLTSLAPAVFQNGVGVLASSGDHSCVLAASNDATGNVALLDANGNLLAGPQVRLAGSISVAAANSNGSEFATDVTIEPAGAGAAGLVFSPDGQSLYMDEPYGNASHSFRKRPRKD